MEHPNFNSSYLFNKASILNAVFCIGAGISKTLYIQHFRIFTNNNLGIVKIIMGKNKFYGTFKFGVFTCIFLYTFVLMPSISQWTAGKPLSQRTFNMVMIMKRLRKKMRLKRQFLSTKISQAENTFFCWFSRTLYVTFSFEFRQEIKFLDNNFTWHES